MKRVALLFIIMISAVLAHAQSNKITLETPGVYPDYKLEKTEHDFGKIAKDKPVTTTFKFQNTGKAPLLILNAKASCGCTAPEYTKDPIPPGQWGFIKVTYNAASVGMFSKTVTVTTNVDSKPMNLLVKGEVLEK